MLENELRQRLQQVARRFRQRQWWWGVAAISLITAIVGVAMLPKVTMGETDATMTVLVLLGTAVVLSLVALVISARSYRDPTPVARRIESKFPSLQQRLLTAISVSNNPDAEVGYLQQQVLREACDHSERHAWTETISNRQVWLSRFSGLGGLMLMMAVFGIILLPQEPRSSSLASIPRQSIRDVIVTPGDTEVERGTNLLVTARFDEQLANTVPIEGELRVISADASELRSPMKRNLQDPVLGGLVTSIKEPFRYQVVTDGWTSKMYSVDVFEFPALVRSDVVLQYPSYTKMTDKTIEDTRRVSGVQGTKLQWKFRLNKPIASARLVTKQGEEIVLNLDDESAVATSDELVLDASVRYSLELEDNQGRMNKYPPEMIVRMFPNQPPKLKTTAAGDVRVSPLQELALAAEVEDDFGVERIGLSYTFGGESNEVVLASDIARAKKQTVEHVVEFESLEAEPDQLLSYYFWAEDVGPNGEVRRTLADMYFAEVRPFEEIFREGNAPPGGEPAPPSENEQQAEKLAGDQKEIIAATWRVLRDGITDEFTTNVKLIAESQQAQLESLDTLAENLQDEKSLQYVDATRGHMELAVTHLNAAADNGDLDALGDALAEEQLSYEGLLKLRAREFEVTRSQQQQSQSSSSSSQQQRQQQLNELEIKQDENRYETEKQAQQESAEEQQERETRQVLSRLRELAKRQEDINQQVAQLQSALEMAEDEEAKEEIERQLKRLRDQQQEMLREIDELDERMQSPENQSSMQEESEQLAETRENVRQASEALQQNDASKALSAGKRAERELEEMREEFRERAAGQFNDAVRDMRNEASELDERQQDISNRLQQQESDPAPGLRAGEGQKQLEEEIQSQRDRLRELQDKMQETVEQAETAEPLLAETLYDSFRRSQQRQVDDRLNDASELLKNGFTEEASNAEAEANEGIRELKEGIDKAAGSVLGDETEALRRAASNLEQLSRDLENEIRNANASERGQSGDEPTSEDGERTPGQRAENGPNESRSNGEGESEGEPGASQNQPGEGQGQPGEGQPGSEQPGSDRPRSEQSESEQSSDGQQGGRQPGQGEPQQGSPGQGVPGQGEPGQGEPPQGEPQQGSGGEGEPRQSQANGEPSDAAGEPRGGEGQQRGGSNSQASPNSQSRNASDGQNSPSASPIAGDGFREWSDQLRDVEEMVDDPEIRSRAARIRDRARDVRADLLRKSKTPQWDLVEDMIAEPLRELQRDVQEEWMRRSAEKNALVPVDRDPVPNQYRDAVQRYYERLGSGQ
ncbi:hypothetical protein SAMN06265222_12621 [Neorhodopirellula lusitana]|uniref:DUF4175 family protein n=1 Tax=Neorhodopirellula lusitana TaxID=445327 RepID=A0ABY1QR01_9BACT|nr:hypothetical protein [Neorhodopirellula lusitana]SMP78471.1 hypothetical protein SAMN06265222_12621 [Neorhodopirellula lusitana]